MNDIHSNEKDCNLLSKQLKEKLGNKIKLSKSISKQSIEGKFYSTYRLENEKRLLNYEQGYVQFHCSFAKDEFLRISIEREPNKTTLGEQLAALSDFYEALKKEYKEPLFVYTLKDDPSKQIIMEWRFKPLTYKNFNSAYYSNKTKMFKFIDVAEPSKKSILKQETRKNIAKGVGLPFELISIIDEDLENYVLHKKGKKVKVPDVAIIDGYPVTSLDKFENKHKKLKRKK